MVGMCDICFLCFSSFFHTLSREQEKCYAKVMHLKIKHTSSHYKCQALENSYKNSQLNRFCKVHTLGNSAAYPCCRQRCFRENLRVSVSFVFQMIVAKEIT